MGSQSDKTGAIRNFGAKPFPSNFYSNPCHRHRQSTNPSPTLPDNSAQSMDGIDPLPQGRGAPALAGLDIGTYILRYEAAEPDCQIIVPY